VGATVDEIVGGRDWILALRAFGGVSCARMRTLGCCEQCCLAEGAGHDCVGGMDGFEAVNVAKRARRARRYLRCAERRTLRKAVCWLPTGVSVELQGHGRVC